MNISTFSAKPTYILSAGDSQRYLEVMGDRSDPAKGIGRLASAIVNYKHRIKNLQVRAVSAPEQADVLVYCRKVGDSLDIAVDYCRTTEAALIFLSSDIDTSNIVPDNFIFITAPNSSLEVIRYMNLIRLLAKNEYQGWQPKIVEHHQEAKKDVSQTAKKIADMLGVDHSSIESVRDFAKTSAQYKIPHSSRDGYAVHSIIFIDKNTGHKSDRKSVV